MEMRTAVTLDMEDKAALDRVSTILWRLTEAAEERCFCEGVKVKIDDQVITFTPDALREKIEVLDVFYDAIAIEI